MICHLTKRSFISNKPPHRRPISTKFIFVHSDRGKPHNLIHQGLEIDYGTIFVVSRDHLWKIGTPLPTRMWPVLRILTISVSELTANKALFVGRPVGSMIKSSSPSLRKNRVTTDPTIFQGVVTSHTSHTKKLFHLSLSGVPSANPLWISIALNSRRRKP